MLFKITGKHIKITDDIEKYAREKTSKLPRYYDSINQIEVIIEGGTPNKAGVEIIASAEHNKVFVVNETGEDLYVCIDLAIHKLSRQITRKKSKERDNKYQSGTSE